MARPARPGGPRRPGRPAPAGRSPARRAPAATRRSGPAGRRLVAPGLPPALALQVVVARPAVEPGVVGPVQAGDGGRRALASSASSFIEVLRATAAPTIASLVCSCSPSLKPAALRIVSGSFSGEQPPVPGDAVGEGRDLDARQRRMAGGVHLVGDDLALGRRRRCGRRGTGRPGSGDAEVDHARSSPVPRRSCCGTPLECGRRPSSETGRGSSRSSPPRWGRTGPPGSGSLTSASLAEWQPRQPASRLVTSILSRLGHPLATRAGQAARRRAMLVLRRSRSRIR